MAGAGYKLFNTGDVLTAAQVNTYLNEQTVMVFADSAARTTALSGVLAEGMMSYLQDTNAVEVYNGSSWVNVGNAGDITEVQAGVGISIASGTGPIPIITNSSTDLITTAGDLLYGTAADTVARLGIGTAGQVLKVNSGATAPEWAALSAPTAVSCSVYNNTNQSIASGSYTTLTFDSEYFDTDAIHSTVTNTGRLTVPAGLGGKWLVTFAIYVGTSSAVEFIPKFQVNGADKNRFNFRTFGSSVTHTIVGTQTFNLVASDYVELLVYQASGVNQNITTNEYGHFGMSRIGA